MQIMYAVFAPTSPSISAKTGNSYQSEKLRLMNTQGRPSSISLICVAPPSAVNRIYPCLLAIGAWAKMKAVPQAGHRKSTLSSTINFSVSLVIVPISLLSSYINSSIGNFFPYSFTYIPPSALTSATHVSQIGLNAESPIMANGPERGLDIPTTILSLASDGVVPATHKITTPTVNTNKPSNTLFFILSLPFEPFQTFEYVPRPCFSLLFSPPFLMGLVLLSP